MMLKEFFTKLGIDRFIKRVRISGETVRSHLAENKRRSVSALKALFRQGVNADTPLDQITSQLDTLLKRRKGHTRSTLRNIMSGVRGQARATLATRRQGAWHNNGVLDSGTTLVCRRHLGLSWRMTYEEIPNKPPRVPPAHPCRSFLTFVPTGGKPPDQRTFIERWQGNESLQRELLGPTLYESMKRGDFSIRSYADFERHILTKPAAAARIAENQANAPVNIPKPKASASSKVDIPVSRTDVAAEIAQPPKPTPTKLSSEEMGRIEYYKGDGFYEQNKILLNPENYDEERVRVAKKMVAELDRIIDKSKATKDVVVMRGMRSAELFESADDLVGKTIDNRTVQSTTVSKHIAHIYAGLMSVKDGVLTSSPGQSVLMKINVRKGSAGLSPGSISSVNDHEKEVLLKANSRYRVTSVSTEQAGAHTYKLIEVEYED